jgi:hypothetical protein
MHSATLGLKSDAHRISVQLHGNEEQSSPVKKNHTSMLSSYILQKLLYPKLPTAQED